MFAISKRVSHVLLSVFLVIAAPAAAAAAAQTGLATITGIVADHSGGVLPGVTAPTSIARSPTSATTIGGRRRRKKR
jgi:hypothetical protein